MRLGALKEQGTVMMLGGRLKDRNQVSYPSLSQLVCEYAAGVIHCSVEVQEASGERYNYPV